MVVSGSGGYGAEVDQAKQFIGKELEQRSSSLASQLLETSDRLHTVAGELRKDKLVKPMGDLADYGAKALEDFSHYLEGGTLESLSSGIESLGRERPLTVTLTAFALGAVGSRALKASAARRGRALNGDEAVETQAGSTRYVDGQEGGA